MRRLLSCFLAMLLVAGTSGSVTRAQSPGARPAGNSSPAAAKAAAQDAETVLEHGLDLERGATGRLRSRLITRHLMLAQSCRFRTPAPALRDPLQDHPPLRRHQFS